MRKQAKKLHQIKLYQSQRPPCAEDTPNVTVGLYCGRILAFFFLGWGEGVVRFKKEIS
jgi:hypothetical protein